MDTKSLTDDQLLACWKQTRMLVVRNVRQQEELRNKRDALEDQSMEYTTELVKRGYQVTLPVRFD